MLFVRLIGHRADLSSRGHRCSEYSIGAASVNSVQSCRAGQYVFTRLRANCHPVALHCAGLNESVLFAEPKTTAEWLRQRTTHVAFQLPYQRREIAIALLIAGHAGVLDGNVDGNGFSFHSTVRHDHRRDLCRC